MTGKTLFILKVLSYLYVNDKTPEHQISKVLTFYDVFWLKTSKPDQKIVGPMPFSYIKVWKKVFCRHYLSVWSYLSDHECLMPTHSTYQKLENAE